MATTTIALRLAYTTRELHTAAKHADLLTFEKPHYLVPLERNWTPGVPAMPISGVRAVKGSTQVLLLYTGAWCELQPGDRIYT